MLLKRIFTDPGGVEEGKKVQRLLLSSFLVSSTLCHNLTAPSVTVGPIDRQDSSGPRRLFLAGNRAFDLGENTRTIILGLSGRYTSLARYVDLSCSLMDGMRAAKASFLNDQDSFSRHII